MKLIFRKTNLVSFMFLCVFILICILYYFACNNIFEDFPLIFNYMNVHDHGIYVSTMKHIEEGNILLSINNNFGIAYIYTFIVAFFNYFGFTDIILICFIFNVITLIFSYIYYIKICDKLSLNGVTKFYFFLGFQLLYFTQLINKDLLTLFFFLLVLWYLMKEKYKIIILLSFLFFFTRIQLLMFGFLCVFLSFGVFKRRVIIAYIGTSILGAITSVKSELISEETMGSGFSSFLIHFNQSFLYTGYLIFNPLRIIQFIIDVYMSFFIYTGGLIDVAKILRIPLLIALLFLMNPIIYSFRNFELVNKTIIKKVFIILISFVFTWLMNPTINARYVMLIVPFLMILGRYVQLNKKYFV